MKIAFHKAEDQHQNKKLSLGQVMMSTKPGALPFDVDVANVAEIDLSAPAQAISWGLMGYAEDQLTRGVNDRAMQSVVVAVTLAAGWLESPERAGL